MKSDSTLKSEVLAELSWDPIVKDAPVGVIVKDGVVTLTGHLSSHAQLSALEHAVRRVHGVRALAVEADVRLPTEHERNDTDIALAAERALEWNVLIPHEKISVRVEKACVTLGGQVEWQYQRRASEEAVRHLFGVRKVVNQIVVLPKFTPVDVRNKIEEALRRQAQREAHHIEVLVDGAEVTLRGQVHSWAERRAAEGAAWSAPGVKQVVNNLLVGLN
ncbi:BON domain-containing protein [Variovorax dokdonensis]|uniref:BON domain-containing protein n=1 Tax=Variovorax dokdonensis TaxID=344883 RepID=A0ABT7NAV5_9BURK|nr:BON domain-containing protein [Variovorax dokdonensis]MDM0045075.1 BON domain-containing protein [Variovorax dokdonensis]